ncbi:TPA: FliC/FljB family flagellin [Proteus mirabilis]|uniref:FliC/FljB family flagellin n=2 Tax=Proteus mirabilis TaxID=584 RepID=UPI0018C7A235|nr:FliC/FljB family flagellin [Proteus mirabilis]EKV6228955.1 FliC/FljB family flagellin [Proteus mirabilis]MBG2847691.1 FliC/FljB family flagellin [Proteus mirabilis]MBG3004877.1 FliC/FljB family flagellin [Proteus mirabilis]MBG3082803.1 FliC/FljB family flagellin [Proteus mirabilis]MBG3086456.1 FliC/FljB family flagellin [Proteus mirabilis]
MAQVINTNYLSLVTQNNLNRSQSALGNAIERLSSGMRINSAKDDAAGQAIANRFTSNINGLTQASRNANDGISVSQTTEGALNEINNNLQRIRELTVQAKNGTNSNSDITSIQNEVNQRLDEINRVSEQTQFNGVKVLSGEKSKMTIQVGTNDNEVIEFNLDKIDNDTLGVASDNLFDAKTEKKGVKAAGNAIDAKQINAAATDGYDNITVKEFKLDGKVVKDKFIVTKGSTDYVVSKSDFELDAKGTKLGLKASATTKFTPDAGKDVKVLNVKDDALATLDNAISKVDESRSKLGAIQNRFQSTINNLNNTVNNLSASRSRILDADYATEVSNMSKNQILQQAGTAVLAQANQVPQTVLSLLR